MGIIKRQSTFSLVFIYLGFIVGTLNNFLLPNFLTPEQLGLTTVLLNIGITITGIATLGSMAVNYKFFPFYKDYLPREKIDLQTLVAGVCLLGFLLVAVLTLVFRQQITAFYIKSSPLLVSYYRLIYPMSFCILLFTFFESYCWIARQTVMSTIQRELVVRLLVTALLGLYIAGVFNFNQYIRAYSFLYLPPAVFLLFFLRRHGLHFSFRISHVTRRLHRRMISFGAYVFAGSAFYIVQQVIDSLFISGLRDLEQTAIYTIPSYMASIIQVPQRSMTSIATPILSESWKNRDYANIRMIYEKSSLNLLIAALFLFLGIWLNLDFIFSILPPVYAAGKWPLLVLGITKIIDMGTGLNNIIISTSNYWKFDFYTSLALVGIIVPGNFFLITHYGIMGAAISGLIAFTVYNAIRLVFIWNKFKLQPFTTRTLKALVFALAAYGIAELLPDAANKYLQAFIASTVYVGLFAVLMLGFRVSEDVNGFWDTLVRRVLRRG